MTESIHPMLDRRGLLPEQHYLDSGYPCAALMTRSRTEHGIELITPLLGDQSPQARAGAGFDRASFTIDFDHQQATCPQGQTSSSCNPLTQHSTDTIVITFSATTYGPCPLREHCTTSHTQRRQLTIHPRDVHPAQRQARAVQDTKPWQDTYALRAGVEATIHQAPAVCDTPPRPATAAYPKPTSNTSSPQLPSISSASTPTETPTPWTAPAPATSPDSNSPPQRDQEIASRIHDRTKTTVNVAHHRTHRAGAHEHGSQTARSTWDRPGRHMKRW